MRTVGISGKWDRMLNPWAAIISGIEGLSLKIAEFRASHAPSKLARGGLWFFYLLKLVTNLLILLFAETCNQSFKACSTEGPSHTQTWCRVLSWIHIKKFSLFPVKFRALRFFCYVRFHFLALVALFFCQGCNIFKMFSDTKFCCSRCMCCCIWFSLGLCFHGDSVIPVI